MPVLLNVPLTEPPEIVAMGRNAHGFEPVDRYCLPDLWSLHLYGYEARVRVDEREFEVRPGSIGLTPPGSTLETHYRGISVHIYVHFRAHGDSRSLPMMHDLGDRYDEIYRRLYAAHRFQEREPRRVASCLWDVLWDLTDAGRVDDHPAVGHPAVMAAVERISKRLSEPISVEALAEEVGVSTSYLAKLFRATYGETVVAFIRRQRAERAIHLLQRSTLPIKAVAASVGIPDLQHFNKLIRSETGLSPRGLRESRAK
ncbi:MAG: helix-turn-helix transcriptional regulator [Armatimonadetes bacterium]|nr:helix-turn-helix transcriptional regulator [Armatimonadota bacterium]